MYMCDINYILWIKYRVHEIIVQNVSNICIKYFVIYVMTVHKIYWL